MSKKKILMVGILGNLAMFALPCLGQADVDSSSTSQELAPQVEIVNFFPASISACDAKFSGSCSNSADNKNPADTKNWISTYENPSQPNLFIGSCGMAAIKDVSDVINSLPNTKSDDSDDLPEVQQALADYAQNCKNSPQPAPHLEVSVTWHPLGYQTHKPETDAAGLKQLDITMTAFFGPAYQNALHMDPTSSVNSVSYDPFTDLNKVGCPNEQVMIKRIKSNAAKMRSQLVTFINNKMANSCAGMGQSAGNAAGSGDVKMNQADQNEGILAPPSGVAR
jgi:hypothetical protein